MATRDMGKLGIVEIRQFYSVWWHRIIKRKTYEISFKGKTYYFDDRSKVWSGTI